MTLFDTHCHFERAEADEIAQTLARAFEAGVSRVMAVGGSVALNASAALAANLPPAADPAAKRPQVCCALGYDRDQVEAERPPVPENVPGLVAWGEIGLDYHYSPETRLKQRTLFSEQLEEARRRDLPVVIHTREADDDTLGLLREIPSRGIIHCFTGSAEFARKLLDLGFYISISGIVTFRLADNVRAMQRAIPDDRLLIETDSPFLAPVPCRGKANEPAFVAHTCAFLARERGVTPEALAALTFANAEKALAAR